MNVESCYTRYFFLSFIGDFMDIFWFTKCLKAIIINFSLLFYFKWIPFIAKVAKLQTIFSIRRISTKKDVKIVYKTAPRTI